MQGSQRYSVKAKLLQNPKDKKPDARWQTIPSKNMPKKRLF
jgi:hypothetical protein